MAQDEPESQPSEPVESSPAEPPVKPEPEQPAEKPVKVEGNFSSGWNTWSTTVVSDSVTYSLSLGGSYTLDATKLEDGNLTVKRTSYAPERDPVVAESTKVRGQHRMPLRLPAARVEWRNEDLAFGEATLSCQVANWMVGDTEYEAWYSVGVPCGGVVKQSSSGNTHIELTAYTLKNKQYSSAATSEPETEPEPEPETTPEPETAPETAPEPETEPEPAEDSARSEPFEHGAPLTMKVPEKIRKAMIDQGKDATRLRVYFEEGKDDNGLKIEYGDNVTEVPVIFAAFIKERCDREVPFNIWSTRETAFIDLAFDIKSMPMNLNKLEVEIVHAHISGETETELGSFQVPVPETGNPWEAMRIPGSLPGINRYTLRLTYTQGEETTTVNGFSHWVIVQAPPMFGFENGVECEASRSSAKDQTSLQATTTFHGNFFLHAGLNPDDLFLRITRKGRRNVNLNGLTPDLRRIVAKEEAAAGWQEVGRTRLTEGNIPGLESVNIDGLNVDIRFTHSLAVTSRVLPLLEDWEYRFALNHQDAAKPIAVWSGKIDLHIKDSTRIASAEMVISTTGMKKPLMVGFKRD
jgi:hypothetical protein